MYVALSPSHNRVVTSTLAEMWRWLCTLEGTGEFVAVLEIDGHGAFHRRWSD